MRPSLLLMSLCLVLFAPAPAFADVDVRDADAVMFPDNVEYDPAIPTPAEFLGFELGRHPVRHHQLVDYLRTVAELSDRLVGSSGPPEDREKTRHRELIFVSVSLELPLDLRSWPNVPYLICGVVQMLIQLGSLLEVAAARGGRGVEAFRNEAV